MQPKTTWDFTDRPDFPRICRELAEAGAIVGRVSIKGEQPVTLVDMTSKAGPTVLHFNVLHAYVTGTGHRWAVLAGDQVKQILGVQPVKVEAFAPTQLLAVDTETASPAPGAVAPPVHMLSTSPTGYCYGVFMRADPYMRSGAFPGTYPRACDASDVIRASGRSLANYLIRLIPDEPKPEKWGLFLHFDQTRSMDYPGEYSSQAAAMALVPFSRKASYYAKKLE